MQPYIVPHLTLGWPTPNSNLVVAELCHWVLSHRFCLPLRFVIVYPVRDCRHRHSAISPIYAFLSGSVDVGGLIIFCPLFPLMFTLVSFTPVISLPVTMVMAFLSCSPVVFLHSLPF